jgi:Fibronectin type III domain
LRHRFVVPAALVMALGAALLSISAAYSNPRPARAEVRKPAHLVDESMIVEVNATDGDAGLQVFLDSEQPWRSMRIIAPDGTVRRLLDIDTRGRLRNFGLTELFSESSEPPFDVFPLAKFKRLFPAGRYRFRGETITGRPLVGSAVLSHVIPRGPEILAPGDGDVVDQRHAVVRWSPVTRPRGIHITGYRLIVEREDPLRTFQVELPSSARRIRISPEFLQPGVEYQLELQAIAASGNQTISQIDFSVG